jgi:hypothetical protein
MLKKELMNTELKKELKKEFTEEEVRGAVDLFQKEKGEKINASIGTLKKGMNIEAEHGRFEKTNVTNLDPVVTLKIALEHIREYPDYYERLELLESEAEKYWEKKEKPDLFKVDGKEAKFNIISNSKLEYNNIQQYNGILKLLERCNDIVKKKLIKI